MNVYITLHAGSGHVYVWFPQKLFSKHIMQQNNLFKEILMQPHEDLSTMLQMEPS